MGILDKLKGLKETIQKGLGDQDNPGSTASSPTEPTMQDKIDALPDGDALQLFPRELAGPAIIRRRLTIDGQMATIWSLKGPVLVVESDGVILRNLRVEVTGLNEIAQPEEGCAILVQPGKGLHTENVEVRGNVIGLPGEEGEWRYPFSLQMGHLAYGQEHEFTLRIYVPVSCALSSNISGFRLEQKKLSPGPNEIRLRLDRLPKDTLICGTISISTQFLKRQIVVNAHIWEGLSGQPAPIQGTGQIIWEPQDWAALLSPPEPEPPEVSVKSLVSPGQEPTPSIPVYPEPSIPTPLEAIGTGSLEAETLSSVTPMSAPEAPPPTPVSTPVIAEAQSQQQHPPVPPDQTQPSEVSPVVTEIIPPDPLVQLSPPETPVPGDIVSAAPPTAASSAVSSPPQLGSPTAPAETGLVPPSGGAASPAQSVPTASIAPDAVAISPPPGSVPSEDGPTGGVSSSPQPSGTPSPPTKRPATFKSQMPLDIGTDLWKGGGDQEKADTTTSQEPPPGPKASGVPKSRPISKIFTTGSKESPLITQEGPPPQEEVVKMGPEEMSPVVDTPSGRDIVPEAKKKPDRKTGAEPPKPGKELKPAAQPTSGKRKLVRQTGISGIFGGGSKEKTDDEEK